MNIARIWSWLTAGLAIVVMVLFLVFTKRDNPLGRNHQLPEVIVSEETDSAHRPQIVYTDPFPGMIVTAVDSVSLLHAQTWPSAPVHTLETPEVPDLRDGEDADFDYNLRAKKEIEYLVKLAMGDSNRRLHGRNFYRPVAIEPALENTRLTDELIKVPASGIRLTSSYTGAEPGPENDSLAIPDKWPSFKGGNTHKFKDYVQHILSGKNDKLSAMDSVQVNFRINSKGYIDRIELADAVSRKRDSLIRSAMLSSPRWKPAVFRNKPVSANLSVILYLSPDTL